MWVMKTYKLLQNICNPTSNCSDKNLTSCSSRRRRGQVVRRLDHGAENRHEVVSSRLGFTMRQLENSHCQPNSEWVPFRIREGYGSDRRGMGSAFQQLCTKYSAKGNLKRSDFNFSNFIKTILASGSRLFFKYI